MWTVTNSDLRLLIRTHKNVSIWLVPIKHRGERWYQMELEIEGLEERGVLFSARKNLRRWKTINIAVEFVEETFPTNVLHVAIVPDRTIKKRKKPRRPKK